jgi:hypothetical protein
MNTLGLLIDNYAIDSEVYVGFFFVDKSFNISTSIK